MDRMEEIASLLSIKENADELIDSSNVVVFNDTDSCGISIKILSSLAGDYGIKITDGNAVTKEGYDLIQESDDYINSEFDKWFREITNTKNCVLNFKREKICDVGIWLKKKKDDSAAKKNYILHILDDEGVKHPKFKYTGVKFAKSVMPAALKDLGKKIVENLLLTQDRRSTDIKVKELWDYFLQMPIEEKASIQRCNNIEKYTTLIKNPSSPDEVKFNQHLKINGYGLRTPGHIRAAYYFNLALDELNLKKYERIKSGDLAKIVFVEKHPLLKPDNTGLYKMAFKEQWPEEFKNEFKIDEKAMFNKIIFEEIKRIYQTIGWPAFNPSEDFSFNLFDVLQGFVL